MAKRIIDADKMWTSTKIARCRPESKPEYPWIYGIADPNGNFEYDPRILYSKAYAIRPEFTYDRFLAALEDFRSNGLLYTWEEDGKLYGHWTQSELPGRLPELKKRERYEQVRVQKKFHIGDPEVTAYMKACLNRPKPQTELFIPTTTEMVHFKAKERADAAQERRLEDDDRYPYFKEFWSLYPEQQKMSEGDTRELFMHINQTWLAAKACVERLKQWLFCEEWKTGFIPTSDMFFKKEKYRAAPLEKEKANGHLTAAEKLERTRRLLQPRPRTRPLLPPAD